MGKYKYIIVMITFLLNCGLPPCPNYCITNHKHKFEKAQSEFEKAQSEEELYDKEMR